MREFFRSRVVQYVLFTLVYMLIWKFVGFEISVICALGTLIGELTVNSWENEERDKRQRRNGR